MNILAELIFVRNWENNHGLHGTLTNISLPTIKYHQIPLKSGYDAVVRLQLPPNMDTSGKTKYPMLIDVYAGPGSYVCFRHNFLFILSIQKDHNIFMVNQYYYIYRLGLTNGMLDSVRIWLPAENTFWHKSMDGDLETVENVFCIQFIEQWEPSKLKIKSKLQSKFAKLKMSLNEVLL